MAEECAFDEVADGFLFVWVELVDGFPELSFRVALKGVVQRRW